MRQLHIIAIAVTLLLALPAGADVILSHGNSTATLNLDSPFEPLGMTTWTVDGTDHMYEQWFWYRIGNGAEAPINTISAPTVEQISPRLAEVTYANTSLSVSVLYLLTGAGNGASDIAETITIRNLVGGTLDLHFFQYSDFDIGASASDDLASFVDNHTVRQWDPQFAMSESTVITLPSHREISPYNAIRFSLNDGGPTTLSDAPNVGVVTPSGDWTWAFQWDASVGSTPFLISKDKLITPIPEPATMALMGGALLLFSRLAMRRRKKG